MYIRVKTTGEKKEVTIVVSGIGSIETNEDGTSTIFMLNGLTYQVIDTQRKIRTQLRRAAEMSNAQPDPNTGDGEEPPAQG